MESLGLLDENFVPFAVTTALVGGAMVWAASSLLNKKGGSSGSSVALDNTKFQPFKLVQKTEISHDTRIFRFALKHPNQKLGLPIGQHMYLRATTPSGEVVQRAYTPISSDDELGYFDLLIKVYNKNVHPKFPDGGKLTQVIDAMAIGDSIDVKGPSGRLEYCGKGNLVIKGPRDAVRNLKVRRLGLIAGGSGITPMMQVVRAVLKDATDKTELYLLFGNQTEEDILMRREIEEAMKERPGQLKVWYTVDRPPVSGWTYSAGFIDEAMLKANMPTALIDGDEKSRTETMILMCGPGPMISFACKPNLEKLGFKAEQMFAF